MNKEVTAILTSCGRFDLLRITLDSFFKFNTCDIKEFFIYEDSGLPVPQDLQTDYPFIKWMCRIGTEGFPSQILALDLLWQHVKTPYAFCMEDDWEFIREGFIEDSMAVMETDPKIMMAWLKAVENYNVQPVEFRKNFFVFKPDTDLWAWHRFNPSLKRKADYDLIAPFSKHTTWNPLKPWKSEADISKVYNNLGFTAAILPEPYIKHIGEGRHVG